MADESVRLPNNPPRNHDVTVKPIISTNRRDRLAAAIRMRGGRRDAWNDWQRLPESDRDFWRKDIDTALAFAGILVRDRGEVIDDAEDPGETDV